jgi:dCTP deaminase
MGIYSNTEIREGIESGNIVVDPYNPAHVNGSSLDLLLGQHFYHSGNGDDTTSRNVLYNPYDESQVIQHFGEAKIAQPLFEHKSTLQKLGHTGVIALKNIPADCPVIILRPHERILAHTHEFAGIINGTSSMHARSTTGRNGLVVCMDAGWGDPGYVNRWTMEIKNMNEQYLVVPIGIRICQLAFHHMNNIDGEYKDLSGKYQTSGARDLATIKRNWKPADMLPKASKDIIAPLPFIDGVTNL